MTALDAFRDFKPAGPVAAAFLADSASRVKIIRGPVGGGKTVSNVFDGLMAAAARMPVCADGRIHFRDAIVGATYGQIERNLYPTWTHWLPRDGGAWTDGEWKGGSGRFAEQKINFDVMRGGRRIEVCYTAIFAAIGELSVEQFVRGFEPSAWYLFELDLLPDGLVEQAIGRLGRWPNRDMLPDGVEWRGYVRGDLNSPDIDTDYYRLVEEVRPPGLRQYVQPSGLSPQAENLQNLPKGYYENLAAMNAHRPKWVRRFILNEYGPSDAGMPVYPEYTDERHLARADLAVDPKLPLEVGIDAGLGNPAAVIGQRRFDGQFRALGEVVPGRMSGRRFAEAIKREVAEIAPNMTLSCGWGDPAGFAGADREDGELAWMEMLAIELNCPILPTDTNAIVTRLDAVREELTYFIDGNTPGLVLSPRCRKLRKGFASHYCYRVNPTTKAVAADAKPDKGDYSHVHDALQYWMLGKKGAYGVINPVRGNGEAAQRQRQARGGTTVLRSTTLSGR
jgi:hypothetical protein